VKLIFANVAKTTLAGPINSTTTTIVVQAGTGVLFPNPQQNQYFTVTMIPASTGIPGEIMWCTGRSGDTLTVIRGQEGTVATAYVAGDTASNRVTAHGLLADAQIPCQVGDPNGVIAGTAGDTVTSPDFVFDVVNQVVWACVFGSSSPATTIWKQINTFQTLLSNGTRYVNASTGSDSNDGLTAGTPWLTLQHAWNVLQSTINFAGFTIRINCTGSFTAGVTAQGGLIGAIAGASSVVFSFASGSLVAATNSSCFLASAFASFSIDCPSGTAVQLGANGTGAGQGYGVLAQGGGNITIVQNVQFNSCTVAQIGAFGSGSIVVYGGTLVVTGTSPSFIFAQSGGFVSQSTTATVTATGTTTYSVAAVNVQTCAIADIHATTFGGSVTGVRYNAYANGVINTGSGGATFIFGTSAGTVNLVAGVYGNGSGQYL